MTQQEVGEAGEFLSGQSPTGLDVLYYPAPAALGAEIHGLAVGSHGVTVAQMVVTDHSKTAGSQIFGKRFVAQNVLGDAVGNLQNSADFAFRQPFNGMDRCFLVGGKKGKFISCHGKDCPLVV